MLTLHIGAEGVSAEHCAGFFVGWPKPPSADALSAMLHRSTYVVTARRDDQVVGFITAMSDGVVAAHISLLEVLPPWQGQGIGSELVRQMLGLLADLYMVDLICDDDVAPFYERLGLVRLTGMARRNRDAPELGAARLTEWATEPSTWRCRRRSGSR